MRMRMFICCFIFTISAFHFSIPNLVFGQSSAQQIFNKHKATILDRDIRPLLPDALRIFNKPEIREGLDRVILQRILDSPNVLKGVDPEFDNRFIASLSVNADLRALFNDTQFYNVLKNEHEINTLVQLIEEIEEIPGSLEKFGDTDNQHGQPHTSLKPFEVIVKDLNGNPLTGIFVTFKITVGDGKFSGQTSVTKTTNSAGKASVAFTLGSDPGIHQIEATVVGFPSLTLTFTAAATTPPEPEPIEPKATTLAIVSGDGQSAEVGSSMEPFVVGVLDQNKKPLQGIAVTFQIISQGRGQLSKRTQTTDVYGQAKTTLTLGNTPGIIQVKASVVDFPSLTQTFTGTAIPVRDPAPEEEPEPPATDANVDKNVFISEIMFASKRGTLPQWIELYNPSTQSVNLENWTLEIRNLGNVPITIRITNKTIEPQQTFLIVSKQGLFSFFFQKTPVYINRRVGLSEEGFHLKLSNNSDELVDEIGNLSPSGNEVIWEKLPQSMTKDRRRVSMIRRYNFGKERSGTLKFGWISAKQTKFATFDKSPFYYGDETDIGGPGVTTYHARSKEAMLPVTLSHFRAEQTEAGILLKWTTESEIDNAGFYILRSETENGEFKIVNPSLIQGAGTTSERNTYTWTDTTAKPNVAYYYRIEDVSHAGAREQSATIRMRGFVSASGKFTTSWANLKTQN